MPSRPLMAALAANAVIGTGLSYAGLPGLAPLPARQALALFFYAPGCCLVVNDAIKVALIGSLVPDAAPRAA